ncbi:MAG: hypothetical protein BWY75_03768 [bacterium ADurb.Bin425]|nr:MAG: hypothetical protein BWY75_03768 [bacterium ADurb.Bin425]
MFFLDISRAPYFSDNFFYLRGNIVEGDQVFTKDFDTEVGFDTGNQVIDHVGDRLRKAIDQARNLIDFVGHFIDQVFFIMGGLPFALGFQADINVGVVDTFEVAAHTRSSNFRDDHVHFGKFHQGLFYNRGDTARLGMRDAGRELGTQENRTLIKRRNEL